MDHQLRIIKQASYSKDGNDCMIYDTIVEYEVHNIIIVEIFRRYTGWCDSGIDYRYRKEFDNTDAADFYYEKLARQSGAYA